MANPKKYRIVRTSDSSFPCGVYIIQRRVLCGLLWRRVSKLKVFLTKEEAEKIVFQLLEFENTYGVVGYY